MNLPSGSWMVIVRPPRDTRSRGTVIKKSISRERAKQLALSMSYNSKFNYWAIEEKDY